MSLVPDRDERRKLIDEWVVRQQDCAKFAEERPRLVSTQLCAAMVGWLRGGNAPDTKLIAAALASPRGWAHETGAMAFLELAHRNPEGRPALAALFDKVSIRSKETLLLMLRQTEGDFFTTIVENSVKHPSPSVRSKAIEAMYWRSTDWVIKLIAAMRPNETDALVIKDMTYFDNLARHGFHAEFNQFSWSWTARYRTGNSVAFVDIPKVVVDAIGIEQAIQHVKNARVDNAAGFVVWDEIVDGA